MNIADLEKLEPGCICNLRKTNDLRLRYRDGEPEPILEQGYRSNSGRLWWKPIEVVGDTTLQELVYGDEEHENEMRTEKPFEAYTQKGD